MLIGTVDKDDGVSAGDIAAGDRRMELQAKGPEHGVCQQRNSQELNGGRKAQVSSDMTSSTPASSSRLEPRLGISFSFPFPVHKIIPGILSVSA